MARERETFKVGTYTVEWWVDRSGKFYCKDPQETGAKIQAPTLDALKKKARTAYNSLGKIEIEVTLFSDVDRWGDEDDEKTPLVFEDATLTGLHGQRDKVIYRDEEGTSCTDHGYSNSQFLRRLTEEERTRLIDLRMAVRVAQKAFTIYLESLRVDARELIETAMKELTDKEPANAD